MAGTDFRRNFAKALAEHKTPHPMTAGEDFRNNFARALEEHKNPQQTTAGESFRKNFAKSVEEHRNSHRVIDAQSSSEPSTSRAVKDDSSSDVQRRKPMASNTLPEEDSDETLDDRVLVFQRVQNPVRYQQYQYPNCQMQKENQNMEDNRMLSRNTSVQSTDDKPGINSSYHTKNETYYSDGVHYKLDYIQSTHAKSDGSASHYVCRSRVSVSKSGHGEGSMNQHYTQY